MSELMNLHTTHGNFNDKDITEDTIKQVLSAAIRGANASNKQSYSIIVIRGREAVKETIGCGFSAPVALLFCIDFNRIISVCKRLGFSDKTYTEAYDNIFFFLTAEMDTIIAAQTADIAAAELGLSTMFTNSIFNAGRKNMDDLYRELNFPREHCFPVAALLLGYSDTAPEKPRGRLMHGVIHYDKYHLPNDAELDDMIAEQNNPQNNFGVPAKGTYLDAYYNRQAAFNSASAIEQSAAMLFEKLKTFHIKGD